MTEIQITRTSFVCQFWKFEHLNPSASHRTGFDFVSDFDIRISEIVKFAFDR